MSRAFRLRPAVAGDAEFMLEMLVVAVNWNPGRRPLSREEVVSTPDLVRYVEGWPRAGDLGVVAEDEAGDPLGAAWMRRFSAADPSYGFVDEQTPELTIGVRAEHRGGGIGRELFRELLMRAQAHGVSRVSLSVEKDNRAVALYRRLGFSVFEDLGDALTMVRALQPPSA